MTARDLRRGCALLLAFLAYLTAAGALTNLVAPEKAPAGSQVYAPRSIPTAADRSRPLIPTRAAPEARASRVSIPTREPSLLAVTAYTWTGNRSACGVWPAVGMAASNTYPCGTRLLVEGVGIVTVEDRIGCCTELDVFLASEVAALRFGRRELRVEVAG